MTAVHTPGSRHRARAPRPASSTHRLGLVLLIAGALLAGCSTVTTRIDENAAWFATLPAPVQHNLRAGIVELGYTPRMAFIAFGEPSERRSITSPDGEVEVWLYNHSYPVYEGPQLIGWVDHVVYYDGGHVRRIFSPPPLFEPRRLETRTHLRLEFVKGRLQLIDQPVD